MKTKADKTILICSEHPDKAVPLISTFAFPGAEFWCPHCGATYGFFWNWVEVVETKDLIKANKDWKKKSADYLDARSTLCCSTTEWEGKMISPRDLPVEEKARLKKIIDEWEHKSS